MPPRIKKYSYCLNCKKKLILKKYPSGSNGKYNKKFCSFKCFSEYNVMEKSTGWKGGKFIQNGYVYVYKPKHKNSNQNGYILEHRFIVSENLKRPLSKNEAVHHINENRSDNRLENLQLMSHGEHSSFHNNGRHCEQNRKYKIVNTLPEVVVGETITHKIDGYRKYVGKVCIVCGDKYWGREELLTCSRSCGAKTKGKKWKKNCVGLS